MPTPEDPNESSPADPPLWTIGLAVVAILGIPVLLYSLAPSGPLREGDTIFSDGEQRVTLTSPTSRPVFSSGESCLLDPDHPLIITQLSDDRTDGSIVARVQGHPAIEWPFCPSHAEIMIKTHQMKQKPAAFSHSKQVLIGSASR